MAVYAPEMHGYPVSRWENGDFFAERRLICYWADRVALLSELDSNPFWPAADYGEGPQDALIRSAQITPFGKPNATTGSMTASYEYAVVTCKYSTRGPKWNVQHGLKIEEMLDPAFHSFAVDHNKLRWSSDGKAVDANDAPINHDVLYEYRIYFHELTSLPPWVLARPGLCNLNTFVTAGLQGISFAPKTLKYMGCHIRGSYTLGRLNRYTLIAKFTHKWSEWNKFWRPGKNGGQWEEMVTKDGDPYVQHTPVTMNLI